MGLPFTNGLINPALTFYYIIIKDMSFTPPINRILFWGYTLAILVVGIAAIIWPSVRGFAYAPLRDVFFPNVYLPTRAGAPVTLSIAAPAALTEWLKASAVEFTRQNPLIQVDVTELRGLDANRRLNTLSSRPDVWLADADFVRQVVGDIPYEAKGTPVAQDGFLWVAVEGQKGLGGEVNWMALSQAISTNPGFKVALPPANSIEGIAACWQAAAEYHHQESVTDALINDPAFRSWLKLILQAAPDRNRAALDQLVTRPPQVDVGLIFNRDWRQLAQELFIQQAPQYNVVYNYPLFVRNNWGNIQADEAEAKQGAADRFKNYLRSSGPQSRLAGYGLQAVTAHLAGQLPAIDDRSIRALRFCWQ